MFHLKLNVMKTELISSFKPVGDSIIVVTATGETIWVPKSQFNESAEQISYREMKAGDEVVLTKDSASGKKGDTIKLKSDRNEFLGCGKQIVQKFSSRDMLDHLISKGITPTFALS
jgi:hypothetical protein